MVIVFILLPAGAVFIGTHPVGEGAAGRHARAAAARIHVRQFHRHPEQAASRRARSSSRSPTCPTTSRTSTRAFANSTIVAVSVTVLTLLFGSLSAYTIARLRYRWTLFLHAGQHRRAVRAGHRADDPALHRSCARSGQLNSLSGVIIAETGFLLPYAILILAPYFDTIPTELEEAARIDGCTRFRRLRAHRAAAGDAGAGRVRRHRVHHLLARAADPADPERAAGLHDPAGGDREPGGRRPRLLQPDDGDLPAGAGADGGPGRAAATSTSSRAWRRARSRAEPTATDATRTSRSTKSSPRCL